MAAVLHDFFGKTYYRASLKLMNDIFMFSFELAM